MTKTKKQLQKQVDNLIELIKQRTLEQANQFPALQDNKPCAISASELRGMVNAANAHGSEVIMSVADNGGIIFKYRKVVRLLDLDVALDV